MLWLLNNQSWRSLLWKLDSGRRNLQLKDEWLIPQLNPLIMFDHPFKILFFIINSSIDHSMNIK